MTIATLIDKTDTFESVRDQIALILTTETASQQALALAATPTPKDPALWTLAVYLERANPWEDYLDAVDGTPPIVNVALDNLSVDGSKSNIVERQKVSATFNVDVYAIGVSETDGSTGQKPGDERASLEVHRAVRLVRNILMAAEYTYLALQGTVWRRWVQDIQLFQPGADDQRVQQVKAARIAFVVEFSEFSPQVAGQALELIATTWTRAADGRVLIEADYPH